MAFDAVVLLSGGLDSYTAAAMIHAQGFTLHALSVRYGQRHAIEMAAARAVAKSLGVVRHVEIDVDLSAFGGSSLTSGAPVPKDRDIDHAEIPSTYVPARNTVFLSIALGWAEVLGARDLVIGVNARDYSGYPDCRPEFIEAFERLAAPGDRRRCEWRHIQSPHAAHPDDEGRDHHDRPVAGARLRSHPQLLRPNAGRTPVPPL